MVYIIILGGKLSFCIVKIAYSNMKILIDNHNILGDFIVFIPTVKKLINNYSDSIFHILVNSHTEEEICRTTLPEIKKIMIFNPDKIKKYDVLKLLYQLRKEHYDLGIPTMLIDKKKARLFLKAAGCKKTVGKELRFFNNDYIANERKNTNEVLNSFAILEALNIKYNDSVNYPYISVPDNSIIVTKEYFSSNTRTVSICLGTGDFTYDDGKIKFVYNCKEWPIQNFIKIKDILHNNGFNIIWLGGEKERDYIYKEGILNELEYNSINLIGKLTYMESIAVIKQSACVIGGDTGLMHCAAALQTPSVSIFGATNPIVAKPFSYNNVVVTARVECQPCITTYGIPYNSKAALCKNRICLSRISVEDVYDSFCNLMEKHRKHDVVK